MSLRRKSNRNLNNSSGDFYEFRALQQKQAIYELMGELETILIAGGTGLIGKDLVKLWRKNGHSVRILSRGEANYEKGIYSWNPDKGELDEKALDGVTVIVNLAGAGIGDKRWTNKRINELYTSRIGTTECLWKHARDSDTLKHYISASGVVCYGFEDDERLHPETDPFGQDLLSDITEKWEAAAGLFSSKCPVAKIRTGVVLSSKGGALKTIAAPIRLGAGTVLGSGKQAMPWIHLYDMVQLYDFVMEHELSGPYNALAENTDNRTLTKTIAKVVKRPLWLPRVPGFVLKAALGKMASVVLDGLKADNSLIRSKGFEFRFTDLEEALREIYDGN